MKRIKIILILLSLVMINITPVDAALRTVKVAYPLQFGLTEIDNDGLYTGYTYDYLKEICRFTNWKLEFVLLDGDENEQIVTAMEMVKNGEIDLMGSMLRSETLINDYDYTATNYGMGNMAILVNDDNADINDTNIYSLKNLNIGIISTKKQESRALTDFGNINGIKIKQNFYSTHSELKTALGNHEIDAMVLSDLSIEEGDYRVVARFSPRPFYFVTTKGNSSLMAELNEAMAQLNKEQPNFMSNLHEKYFSLTNTKFVLSENEQNYINKKIKINVLFLGGRAPLQYYDNKLERVAGITPDVLDYISEISGLKFNYLYTDNVDEYNDLIKTKKPLIIGGVYESVSEDYFTTKSYLRSGVSLVTNKNVDAANLVDKRRAAVRNMEITNISLIDENTVYYDTPFKCLKAVNDGTVDYSYLNSHIALFYNDNYKFDDINIIPQGNQVIQASHLAVSKQAPLELLNIINKGIDTVLAHKIEDITITNASVTNSDVTFFDYVENNPFQVIAIIIMIISIVALFFLIWRNYVNKRNNEKILDEYYRYQQISKFSHACFIEYNIASDTLVLMGGGAKLLSNETIIKNYLRLKMLGSEVLAKVCRELKAYDTKQVITSVTGVEHLLNISLRPIFSENNKVTHIVGKAIDMQVEKEEQILWKNLARKDSLTKIYNSVACREMVDGFLIKNPDTMVAFIIIDIDHFKAINDTYGHLCGDIILQKMAALLADNIDPADIFGRVGGDEFLVMVKDAHSFENVEKYCQKIMAAASQVEYEEKIITTSISIGGVIYKGAINYDDLYKLADEALYKVKKSSRDNCWIIDQTKKPV